MERQKILLDTDIGQDMDDACSIAYLCAKEEAELVGITTVSGDAVNRAKLVSAVCRAMGKTDIPIYPGVETCILKEQRQTFCPQTHLLENWKHQENFPMNQALYFMQNTIRENPGEIILVGIGPASNIGLLFQIDPEIPSLLKGLYIMGGKYQQYNLRTWRKRIDENTFSVATEGQNMEWNACIDPLATAIMFERAPRLTRAVGIDITHQVTLTPAEFKNSIEEKLPPILREMSKAWIDYDPLQAKLLCYHDPVAVASIFNKEICEFQRGNIEVETISPRLRGYTYFEEDPEGRHEVACAVNPDVFFKEFVSVFE